MTKVDKRALEYAKTHAYLGYDYDQTYDAVKYGYLQAEKDLALTWEDIAKIITIYEAGIEYGDYNRYNDAKWMKEYSMDILKRFNEIGNDEHGTE